MTKDGVLTEKDYMTFSKDFLASELVKRDKIVRELKERIKREMEKYDDNTYVYAHHRVACHIRDLKIIDEVFNEVRS